jgi:hypothetical protein
MKIRGESCLWTWVAFALGEVFGVLAVRVWRYSGSIG